MIFWIEVIFLNGSELLNDIKIAALEAVSAAAPCEIKYGIVTSVKPLLVRLEQRITLSGNMLVLPRKFTDHRVRISGGNVNDFYFLSPENSDTNSDTNSDPDCDTQPVSPPHKHAVGEMEITVHGGLKVGEKLILIRQQGGQKYLIFDAIPDSLFEE